MLANYIKTHWEANIFLSISTAEPDMEFLKSFGSNSLSTYLVLKKDTDIQQVETIISDHYEGLRQQEIYSNYMKIIFCSLLLSLVFAELLLTKFNALLDLLLSNR